MGRIGYTVECPECREAGEVSHLGFETEKNHYSCDGSQPHIFEEMPGEEAPKIEDLTPAQTNKLPEGPNVETAAPVITDESSKLAEIMAKRSADQPAIERAEPLVVAPLPVAEYRTGEVLVGVGKFARLPGGDLLCGIRVPEQWASALEAECETRTPPITPAEYLQELIDQGMLEWFAAPAPAFNAPDSMAVRGR